MRIVVAPDSFKGSLSAHQAARVVARGLSSALPDAELVLLPLADGGEGTAEVWRHARGGSWRWRRVTGPLPGTEVDAGFLRLAPSGEGALVEMATASGLGLLAPEERAPLRTTTRGTGELLAAAAAEGAVRLTLAVGGSATVDGGTGAAAVLGWRFLDRRGRELPPGGGALVELATIEPPSAPPLPSLTVLCDVDHPLCGPEGAARVFAPQKGANPADVQRLGRGLERLAEVVERDLGLDLRRLPRGGAAGGLAAGARAFLAGELVDGADAVMDAVGLSGALEEASWVVTGEGMLDAQSKRGKVVASVARRASRAGVHVAAVAGRIELSTEEREEMGLDETEAAVESSGNGEDALERAEELVEAAARRLGTRLRAYG